MATAGGIAPGISDAADQADRLAGALANVDANSFLLSRRFADEEALMNMPLTVDPRNRPSDTPARGGGGGGGNRASAAEKQAATLKKLTEGLQLEIDLLQELDPIEQEMIRLRGQLGDATAAETDRVRELIEKRTEEQDQLDENIAKLDFMRDSFRSFLDIFRRDGDSSLTFLEKLWGSLDKIGSKLTDLALNNLTDVLFGEKGSGSGGGLGDFFGKLLGGIKFNAMGDVFDGPTMFGYGSGQLGILGEAGKEGVMPLTHSFGDGVGAKLGGSETTLPLTRLNSGKLGVSLFANGGTFGGYAAPVRMAAVANDTASSAAPLQQMGGGAVVHNHWNIRSDNPRSFAESKATTARAANQLMAGLGRHS
ncbi:MAG: hypothetical protein GQ535_14865 [Rhodobacteraceae bacterium]|nr:hypothetical protein [Paracoccaceae bacterium]